MTDSWTHPSSFFSPPHSICLSRSTPITMLRLRPVVTRQWIEDQGVYAPDQPKPPPHFHNGDTHTAHNGHHTAATARDGRSDTDGWHSGTLRPCQCRMTASTLHSVIAADAQPVTAPTASSAPASPVVAVYDTKATPVSPPSRSPVATPSVPAIGPLSSFPASSLASLPSSSSRSSKPYKAVVPINTAAAAQQYGSPRLSSSPSVPPSATASPATSDSSSASTASVSSSASSSSSHSPSATSSPAQRSEWSDDESISRLPLPYSTSPWPTILAHILHVLSRDAISRSTFASQVHLSLSTVSRALSGQPRVKRVEYGRMRVWLWRRDEEYVRVRESEGRGGSGVTEVEWNEWRVLTMPLEQRQRVDALLIAADEGAAADGLPKGEVEAQRDGEDELTDVSMDTDSDGVKEEASSMEVDSNGADSGTATVTDETVNVKGTRNGGRNSRGRKQSPALRPTIGDPQTAVTSSSLASLPSSLPTATSASTMFSSASTSSTSSSAPSTPSFGAAAPFSAASSPSSSSSSSPCAGSSFLLSSLPVIPATYFTSADSVIDRLDFYIVQLHLSQKSVAHLTSLPLTTVSQLIRRVYKPWPTDDQPLTGTSSSTASTSAAFVAVVALLWWLDGMLSGLVRGRVGNVHDTCNLAFLSSLTVSGLSRERLNVWLDGKTTNPLYDRQWIDGIAIKEFSVTQEVVMKEWDKTKEATAMTTAGATEAATAGGSGG